MFRVITVPDPAASLTEQLGTKPKFWFRDEEGQRWLFKEAGKLNPKAADAWLARLKIVSSEDIALIFGQIPQDRITQVASQFGQRMLELNRQRLLILQGAWK